MSCRIKCFLHGCFPMIACLFRKHPSSPESVTMFRVLAENACVEGIGLLQVLYRLHRQPHVEKRPGMPRVEGQALSVLDDRFFGLSLTNENRTEIIVVIRVLRIDPDRLPVVGRRPLQITLLEKSSGQVAVRDVVPFGGREGMRKQSAAALPKTQLGMGQDPSCQDHQRKSSHGEDFPTVRPA